MADYYWSKAMHFAFTSWVKHESEMAKICFDFLLYPFWTHQWRNTMAIAFLTIVKRESSRVEYFRNIVETLETETPGTSSIYCQGNTRSMCSQLCENWVGPKLKNCRNNNKTDNSNSSPVWGRGWRGRGARGKASAARTRRWTAWRPTWAAEYFPNWIR